MPNAPVDILASASSPDFLRLPLTIEQHFSRSSALMLLLLLVPALVMLLVPVAVLAASAPPAVAPAAQNPMAALQAVIGLLLWAVLFVVPAQRIVGRLGAARSVRIEAGRVGVRERRLLRSTSWEAPLADFVGIAHHVRTSLSGVRHDLHLVHADAGKSLLIYTGETMPQSTIDGVAALLGLRPLPAGALYRFGVRKRSEAGGGRAPLP